MTLDRAARRPARRWSSASRRPPTWPPSPARPTSSRGSARPGSASRRSGSCSTAGPTCAGGSAAARPGCCCSATTTRSGRWARWPTRPCSVEDGVLRGPGCFDMKAGLVMAFHAAAGLDGVTLLVTGDEELGSPSSRELIEDEARLRRGRAGARGVRRRRRAEDRAQGRLLYDVRVVGRAAHAGLEPERGVNATIELAHQVLLVSALADPAPAPPSRRPSPAPARPPTPCPPTGPFAVDVRVRTLAEQDRVDGAMRALRPVLPGADVEVTGGPNRPPLEAASSAALFERVRALAVRLGLPEPVAARSAARPTATSPPASARRPSTGSARSAAARTPTTSTCSSTSCPAAPRCCARWSRSCSVGIRTNHLATTGAARP